MSQCPGMDSIFVDMILKKTNNAIRSSQNLHSSSLEGTCKCAGSCHAVISGEPPLTKSITKNGFESNNFLLEIRGRDIQSFGRQATANAPLLSLSQKRIRTLRVPIYVSSKTKKPFDSPAITRESEYKAL